MTKRTIVKIDEEKCTGCGKCVAPCAEGAIQIINGKAKVVSEELYDGIGFCIGICPENAISIEERHTVEFNREKAEAQPRKKTSLSAVLNVEPAKTSITSCLSGAIRDAKLQLCCRNNF
jgi:MinD superfamily P-loop ATPase